MKKEFSHSLTLEPMRLRRSGLPGSCGLACLSPRLAQLSSVRHSMMRLAIFGIFLSGLTLAAAAEVTVTNDTEAAQWQKIYGRIRTEMGITNVEEMMKIPLFRAKIVHPAFGIYWDEVPAPSATGTNTMAAVNAFVSTNGWDMQKDGIVFSPLAPDKSKVIRGLPWTEIQDREFPAVTHNGILYVFFTGWHYNNQGVAYNPRTNTFAHGFAAFKPIGQHWYVWATTDDLWEGPKQYEGTNKQSAVQGPPANGSQPFSSGTNREPSAAGSRR